MRSLALITILLAVSSCTGPSPSNAPLANGGFLRVESIKLILKYYDTRGRFPVSSEELTKAGLLPTRLMVDRNLKTYLYVDEHNFRIDELKVSSDDIIIKLTVADAVFVEDNTISALQTLR